MLQNHHHSEPNPTFNLNLNQILATAFHPISDVQIKEQLTDLFKPHLSTWSAVLWLL